MPDELTGAAPRTPEKARTPFEILYRHVSSSIPAYQAVLRSDSEEKITILGKYSKRLLGAHLEQLDLLKETLDRFKTDQAKFSLVDPRSKLIETRDFPRRTFTARFAPVGEPLPVGAEKP